MEVLSKEGLQYTLNKLFKLCGNTDVMLPKTIYQTNSEETIKSMVMGALSVNSQLKNISTSYNNTIQFYATTTDGLTKTDDSIYMGCGTYCGNGSTDYSTSIGVLQAYIFESNGTTLDFKILNKNGTLSIL